jgi:ATP-binding cassette, subfamily B, bacterial HlyB/CyaB
VDFEQLEASAGIGGSFGIPEMLSTAEAHGYYAWQHNCAWEDLVAVPFPALAELREGRFLVLGAFAQDRVLLQDPARLAHVAVLGRDEFVARWSGRLVLLTTRGIASRRP